MHPRLLTRLHTGSGLPCTNLLACVVFCLLLWAPELHAAASQPTPAQDEFHFVVLGDSQFHDVPGFNRMIDDLTHIRPAFVVQVGDMIEGYSNSLDTIAAEWARFAEQIAPLQPIPFVPVPGNHDLYNAYRRADRKIESLYRERWGPTYRFFDYRNTRIVILNSDAPGAESRIGPDQFRWLRETLASSAAEHIFVFLHRPPDMLKNFAALHGLLQQYPVRHVFYGHLHHYHFVERDGIGYVMTNAAATSGTNHERVGSFHHFLQVSVRDDQVRFASIRADAVEHPDFVSPTDNYDLYDIVRGVAPKQVELLESDGQWLMAIPLTNPTQRTLAVFAQCGAADDRWQHQPEQIPMIELKPDEQYELRLSWQARHSEMLPSCSLGIPFQTRHGDWLQQTLRVDAVRGD